MKQKLLLLVATLIIGLFTSNLWAQAPAKPALPKGSTKPYAPKKKWTPYRSIDTVKNTDFSLNGQYQFMLSRSKSINGYKLVNPTRLAAVWKSVSDTLKKERSEFRTVRAKLSEQEQIVNGLKRDIDGKENTLNTSIAKVNEINFLGISFEKSTYHLFVWSIILLLGLGLLIVIIRSAKSVLEAKHRTQLYEEVTAEYHAFKSKSNEQQRKLARELQDERNKLDEMRGQ